jgi:CRP/FNR family transcriptional regulator
MPDSYAAKLDSALAKSVFSHFPTEERERLFAKARRLDLPAGAELFIGATPQPALVVEGAIKVFMIVPDGRQLTVHYVKEGGSLGILAMVGGPPPTRLQAIAPTTVLIFDEPSVRALVTGEAGSAYGAAEELARIYIALLSHLAVNVFGNVRQRVCSHLLNLATTAEDGKLVAAPVTQQDLANAVGTAREVVSRTLGSLTRTGLISVSRDRITINDPQRMLEELETVSV